MKKKRCARLAASMLVAMLMLSQSAASVMAADNTTDMPEDNQNGVVFVQNGAETPDEGNGDAEAKDGIFQENGAYYLYVDGVMQKAQLVEYKDKLYFAKADGKLARNELLKIEGEYYYASSDCSLAKGIFTNDKGAKYYADESSKVNIEENVIKINNTDTYTTRTGQIKSNQFIVNSEGKTLYLGADGKITKGVFKAANGRKYYADPTTGYVVVTNMMVTYNGQKYIVEKGGSLSCNKIAMAGGLYYWVNSDYHVVTSNFVYVNLGSQVMYYYLNGRLYLSSRIVSGKLSTPTPAGDFKVTGKARNIPLTGPDWNVKVSYWISFVGSSIGFHDASWRAAWEFNDGSRYKKNGSHGCVNMPYSKAQALYNSIKVGTLVIVRR